VKSQALHLFFLATFLLCPAGFLLADLTIGQIYSLTMIDMDGHTFHTDDGHVTVVVLTTSATLEKAETVGDRTPDYCLGNPAFRMITVVKFQKHIRLVRAFLAVVARQRLEEEANRLQTRYDKKEMGRKARLDVHAVIDFDGQTVSQLGGLPDKSSFRTFVFARNGELLREWKQVPSAEELAAVVK
jgi:hypothetical protein